MNNVELFCDCLKNPEPLFDEYYFKIQSIIDPQKSTRYQMQIKDIRNILDNLYALWKKDPKNSVKAKHYLSELDSKLYKKGSQFCEFAAFLKCIDISLSRYKEEKDKERRLFVLEKSVKYYLKYRYNLYNNKRFHANDTILQVLFDAHSHKRSSGLFKYKIKNILKEFGFEEKNFAEIKLESEQSVYIFLENLKDFEGFLQHIGIKNWPWIDSHQKKIPDILIRFGGDIYIIECKHMNEGGGGQDKQISELISFLNTDIPGNLSNIHMVSFLDGAYWNKMSSADHQSKLGRQREKIIEVLKKDHRNYFVNTFGFRKILSEGR